MFVWYNPLIDIFCLKSCTLVQDDMWRYMRVKNAALFFQISPNLVRYGNTETANFFAQSTAMAKSLKAQLSADKEQHRDRYQCLN